MPQNSMFLIIVCIGMVLVLFMTSRSSKKLRQTQQEQRENAIAIGKNVMTSSGFFGKIVDIDGDAITLQSPSGDETVWHRTAIHGEAELPLEQPENAEDEVATDNDSHGEAKNDLDPLDPHRNDTNDQLS